MQSYSNIDLSPYHTFAISQKCRELVEVNNLDELIQVYQSTHWQSLPKLILGKGSNVLFTEAYDGLVVVNRILGKKVVETDSDFHLHIAAGEDWPSLVQWSVDNGYAGLENLALIPGCAGSAPIQNIGAYGIEFQHVCEYVDILCLDTLSLKRLSSAECEFGYRDSIFKNSLYQKAVVVAIGLKLSKHWQPNIEYGPLTSFSRETVTPSQIFKKVSDIRNQKLPNPEVTGNAGSFFKNPVISESQYEELKVHFPEMVAYPAKEGVKVAAGWLIDQCGLKGFTLGGAQVHPNQALVIVNKQDASAVDVVSLAAHVCKSVVDKYGIELEHEVRFMGASSETKLHTILESQQ
ncbi:UDP-N-acetylmuramate dehydrogenase [Vibrio paucivorans]